MKACVYWYNLIYGLNSASSDRDFSQFSRWNCHCFQPFPSGMCHHRFHSSHYHYFTIVFISAPRSPPAQNLNGWLFVCFRCVHAPETRGYIALYSPICYHTHNFRILYIIIIWFRYLFYLYAKI